MGRALLRLREAALPVKDVYPEPPPLTQRPEPVDLAKRSELEEDAWARHQHEWALVDKYAERDSYAQGQSRRR